jgi:hypothetical protein
MSSMSGNIQKMIRGWRSNPLWPRAGKIHLGELVTSQKTGREHPKDLPYFNCSQCPEVEAKYGPRPTSLPVMVPSPNICDWFPIQYKRYAGENRLVCRGDGVTAITFSEQAGGFVEQTCPGRDCEFYGTKCQEIGNLMLILYDVNMLAVYQIDTGSFYGSNKVYDSFEMALNMVTMATRDPRNVCRIQFQLVREECTIPFTAVDERTGAVTRETQTKSILNLIAPPMNYSQCRELYEVHQEEQSQLPAPRARMLVPHVELDPDDEILHADIEIDESQPVDLYPGAAPVAASLKQRDQWAKLLEQAAEFGADIEELEARTCGEFGAASFAELCEDNAEKAIEGVRQAMQEWAAQSGPAPEAEAAGGPSEGQTAAWSALLQQVETAGKVVAVVEKAALKGFGESFAALDEEQAGKAITRLTAVIQNWQGGTKPTLPRAKAANGNGNGGAKPAATPAKAATPAAADEQSLSFGV